MPTELREFANDEDTTYACQTLVFVAIRECRLNRVDICMPYDYNIDTRLINVYNAYIAY